MATDGSELSELALPIAQELARAQGAKLTFVRVVEPPAWSEAGALASLSAEVYQEVIEGLTSEAEQSLGRLAASVRSAGLMAETAVLQGVPAARLLDYEAETKPDLVVMASHGRTGLARFALGSVADRMVREGLAPVVIVRSLGAAATVRRALVLLDGSALAETALRVVEAFAGQPLHSVRLLRAVSSQKELEAASVYLAGVAARLSAIGLFVDPEVAIEGPGEAIERAAEDMDLVIMATHGRGGLDRLRHGSVAERALQTVSVPLLLVRAGVAEAQISRPRVLPSLALA
jgi:nucleotide-binding universal stress UspA family protein